MFVHMSATAVKGLISCRLYARYSEAVKLIRQRTHPVCHRSSPLHKLAPPITFWEKVSGITSLVSNEAVTPDRPCVADHPPDTYVLPRQVARRRRPVGPPPGCSDFVVKHPRSARPSTPRPCHRRRGPTGLRLQPHSLCGGVSPIRRMCDKLCPTQISFGSSPGHLLARMNHRCRMMLPGK